MRGGYTNTERTGPEWADTHYHLYRKRSIHICKEGQAVCTVCQLVRLQAGAIRCVEWRILGRLECTHPGDLRRQPGTHEGTRDTSQTYKMGWRRDSRGRALPHFQVIIQWPQAGGPTAQQVEATSAELYLSRAWHSVLLSLGQGLSTQPVSGLGELQTFKQGLHGCHRRSSEGCL